IPMKIRSMVGLIPLFACEVLESSELANLPGFTRRLNWFLQNRGDLARNISYMQEGEGEDALVGRRLLAIPSKERLLRVLRYMLDEKEFLSPYGIRSLSRIHQEHPYRLGSGGSDYSIAYDPGESTTYMFGGNSNWRGPVWFPVNALIIESLERYHHFYGDALKVEYPTGSGNLLDLKSIARELAGRLVRLFVPDSGGTRPVHGRDRRYAEDPAWKDLLQFYEYFHGDDGRGIGAAHQTGWTAMVTRALEEIAKARTEVRVSVPPVRPVRRLMAVVAADGHAASERETVRDSSKRA
ncbi:MAG TPA: hypothetical protein VEJ86_00245, partial [Candidatus Binataceae bacterium]|nr:hypothetical protein [Candidatus Binataceae bacterium]